MADMQESVLRLKMHECGIPSYMREGIVEFILHGRPMGNFLTAVLSNDLKEACARADENNLPIIHKYVFFLYNYAPGGCWGSEEHVQTWRDHRGLEYVEVEENRV